MIEVKSLTKKYGTKHAVSDISFTVDDGEILGFLGPNGAGKSTTMNIITGYISSTEGTVTVNGKEILADPLAVKSQIGYLPEQPPLYLDMTVKEYLSFMFDLKKVRAPKRQHIGEICERVMITDVYGRIIKNLSKGYRQRVGLAQALLGDPGVLILDEPTVGLDPKQILEIRNLIKRLGKKHTVILSSHILSEVQAVCERIIVINGGKLIADDTPDRLSRALSTDHRFTLRVAGPEKAVYSLLTALPKMKRVDRLGEHEPGSFDFILEPEPECDVRRALFAALSEKRWPILELRGHNLSLEDVFLRLTAQSEVDLALQRGEEAAAEGAEKPEPSGEARPEETLQSAADENAQSAGGEE